MALALRSIGLRRWAPLPLRARLQGMTAVRALPDFLVATMLKVLGATMLLDLTELNIRFEVLMAERCGSHRSHWSAHASCSTCTTFARAAHRLLGAGLLHLLRVRHVVTNLLPGCSAQWQAWQACHTPAGHASGRRSGHLWAPRRWSSSLPMSCQPRQRM